MFQQTHAEVTHLLIMIRYRKGYRPPAMSSATGRLFDIQHINVDEVNRTLILHCVEKI
ncbi:hypothetical protein P7H20_25470 [Paenibacillus larvae]|nr:hypothetical protein [Paenibacillus larvae]MDT2277518.1 hypothetical protein [Paenibacillus larvae]